jgi:glycosyltransferase involved in cell wall biosynthesis
VKVRFSPDVFRFQRFGGVSRYFVELHRGLLAAGVDSRIVAGLHINQLLDGETRVTGIDVSAMRPDRARQALSKGVDGVIGAAMGLGLGPHDIYHGSWYPPLLPLTPRRPIVVTTVFDMIAERYPTMVARAAATSDRKRRWCERADHVFAISNDTRDDLVSRFGIDPVKITVTHLGVRRVEPAPIERAWADRPYVLYVGDRLAAYKNFEGLVVALAGAGDAADVALVCFGGGATTAAEAALFDRLGLADRVHVVNGDDRALAACYAGARALVYPSLYEGFGLPPLEAMLHDCPVLCSNRGAVPEIVGDAGAFFEPDDPEQLATSIVRVIDDGDWRRSLVEAGRARAARFTWASTVDGTLAVYRELAGGSR